jgi:hypothetical protein
MDGRKDHSTSSTLWEGSDGVLLFGWMDEWTGSIEYKQVTAVGIDCPFMWIVEPLYCLSSF